MSGPRGRYWQLRICPYRTADNRIDGAVLVLFDIDERCTAQAALQEARDDARAIVETVREPLLVLDAQLRVEAANPAYYTMFAVEPEATLGRSLFDLGNRQWDIPALRRQLGEAVSEDKAFAEFEIEHDFESIGKKVMRLNARRVRRGGARTELVLLAIEDHTELARLEAEASRHVERLVEDGRDKTAFLALLAHELRNPLAPIKNALHVLERTGSPDATATRMRVLIDRQVQQLTRLVDDLLDVARISRGRIEIRKERVEPGALVDGAVDAARPSFAAAGVELTASHSGEALPLDADPIRLTQAIGNLLNNACKFTDRGGSVALSLEREGAEAVIRVRDSGIGMAADQLVRIFEMFVQIDGSLGRSRSGLGLGLALVKELIEAHGGNVVARSDGIGRGSEFEFRLPLAPGPQRSDGDAPAGLAATLAEPAAPPRRRILVVDDNVDVVESLAAILAADGHEVRTAHDGLAGLALAASWRPDAVLLDIGMPGMDGYETARRLRAQPWGRGTLLAAITGWGQPEDMRRTAEAGFDVHLVKPVDPAVLMKLVAGPLPTGAAGR